MFFHPPPFTLDPLPFAFDPGLVTLDPRPSTKRQTCSRLLRGFLLPRKCYVCYVYAFHWFNVRQLNSYELLYFIHASKASQIQ